ncbi:glycosyltransferase [Sphingomonas prati]|uniref:Glycosyltransferase involved in cell wall biosynthesis n=1 Tax=Sphingomonas prati TaxID=1843237 RepID=A0A7W9BQH6_9SPHN|nr:glycosyltransferase [Sphingomonas prati]MBB5728096.1 glycosyltransferase involved in cell wall biosynthesis [Sphingomonas prati]GGE83217.1 hypothetical protein GCM10011404_14910 [Sphingomonas prati]
MRIAIYVHDMRASGVVRAMIALARYLVEEGHDAVLIAGSSAGHFGAGDVAPARFVAATVADRTARSQLRRVPAVRRVVRAVAPDVLLSGGNHGHVTLWAATRGLRIPRVFVFSNPMERVGQPIRNCWRIAKSAMLIAASARSVVVGRNLADDAAFSREIAAGRVVLIRNGIARAGVAASPVPAAMVDAVPTVLAVGRLTEQKNYEGLIAAIAAANRVRQMRLVVLGGGNAAYRDGLAAQAAALGVGDRVLFAGVTDDVYAWLRAARVFAIASWWEGSSIALLEAVDAGVPIVASTTAGDAVEVLDGGRYGLIVAPDDAEGFAAALLRQVGEDPVRPGDRILAYDAVAMMRAYRDLLVGVVEGQHYELGLTPNRLS